MVEEEKQPKTCEFWLVRYVPDPLKEEFVNIGVVLLHGEGTAEVRFARDWRRVRSFDPDVDLEMLQATEAELQQQLQLTENSRARILNLLNESFSSAVQVSAPKAILSETPELEMEQLAGMYLDSVYRAAPRRSPAGHGAIVAKMRTAFTEAGVWRACAKKIPVAKYTHPGEKLKLDCGYRPNGIYKFFQGLPLSKGADAAKALAYTYPQLCEGIARVEGAKTQLTAVVESRLRREDSEIAFAIETLQRASILIAGTDDMPRLAQAAREELHL